MDKYKNKYRIASARAQWWDYGWNGAYFITICTQNREHFFGEINDGKMVLSSVGVIADILWHEIPNHSKFVELGDFVVMPNHIHGILILDKPVGENANNATNNATNVETRLIASLQPTKQPTKQPKTGGFTGFKNPMLNDNVSRIIRWYKGRCSFEIRKIHADFAWQPRFHDHIIRDDAEYQRISDYIINNPANWKDDKFYTA